MKLIGYVMVVFSVGAMTAACSSGGPQDRQRPVYDFQNVDMRPDESAHDRRQASRPFSREAPPSADEGPSSRR